MDYKLKNRDGVETTYAKEKIKIPAATGDSMVVFTEGEVQAEKTVDITENGEFSVEPDAGFDSIRQVKCRVGVNGGVSVRPITITENGTTTAPDGYAYSPITVNVPPTSGYQLKNTIATYGMAMQNEDFTNIIYQAVIGTVERPDDWDIPMFPLCIGLNVNGKGVYCWCSSIVDLNTGVALFPGCFYADGKRGYMEFKFYGDDDDNLFFESTRLELDGENIISQITDSSYIVVATLFSGNTESNS